MSADVPRISIVIGAYNQAAFLPDAIGSALSQSYANCEVIVIDDGSTDGSREVIARFGDHIDAVYQANGGQAAAYNAGFARASGEFVLFLDADDRLDADACACAVAAFAPGVAKVHFRLRLIDAQGRELGKEIPRQLELGELRDVLLRERRLYASAPGSGNVYRRSDLSRVMPIEPATGDRHGGDFYLILASALLGRVASAAPRALGGYRVHDDAAQHAIAFGNCSQHNREPEASYRRYAAARQWLGHRLGLALPEQVIDFSLEKQAFAAAVFDAPAYLEGLSRGGAHFARRLLPSIRRRPGSVMTRLGLTGWALAVLVLPRSPGLSLARLVCNPAAR